MTHRVSDAGVDTFREPFVGPNSVLSARSLTSFLLVVSLSLVPSLAAAETASQRGLDKGQYIPNIWVDPDGCEHWIMDDGVEGYMTPHVTRDGIPVCREGNVCATVKSDTFFATDSAAISAANQQKLRDYFAQSSSRVFAVEGHTDSTSSDAYNLELSRARAQAVAVVARQAGATVRTVTGYGERQPVASNSTSAGRALNRRVEILCIR